MARIWSCGFEQNSLTKGEIENVNGSVTISTAAARSGTYGMRVTQALGYAGITYRASGTAEDIYYRMWIRINSLSGTGAVAKILTPGSTNSGATQAVISLLDTRQLGLYTAAGTLIGSLSSAVSTGQWYRVELRINSTTVGATIWTFLLDGVQVATTSSIVGTAGYNSMVFGMKAAWTGVTTEIDFDDLAINSSSGATQNSYPGDSRVVHLFVNGDGDTANRGTAVTDYNTGPTGGLTTWQMLDDKPTPNDGTDYLTLLVDSTGTTNRIHAFAMEAATVAGINTGDTIHVVQPGARVTTAVATGSSYAIGIKSQASGTIVESAAISLASTSWFVHDDAAPKVYPLSSHVDPQAGGAWTPALLDSMQITVRAPDATPAVWVTQIWALVDYTPAVGGGGGGTGGFKSLLGVGR